MLFCSDLERQVDAHESQLVEIDQQQKHLLANVRKETELLEEQRKMLSDELGKASNKLSVTTIFGHKAIKCQFNHKIYSVLYTEMIA